MRLESPENTPLTLSKAERELIIFIRSLKYGEFKVRVQAGKPVLIERALQTIKLGNGSGEQQ